MTNPSDVGDELKTFAYLSMRTGIPIPDLMELEDIYISAYLAVLEDEAEAHKKPPRKG